MGVCAWAMPGENRANQQTQREEAVIYFINLFICIIFIF
jgi:hypothetical protein